MEVLREIINLQNICSDNNNSLHNNNRDYTMSMLTSKAKERLSRKDSKINDLEAQCEVQAIIIDELMRGVYGAQENSPVLPVKADMLDLLMRSTLGFNND